MDRRITSVVATIGLAAFVLIAYFLIRGEAAQEAAPAVVARDFADASAPTIATPSPPAANRAPTTKVASAAPTKSKSTRPRRSEQLDHPSAQEPQTSAAVPPTSATCSGFYVYIPPDIDREVPFSLKVEQAAIEVVWMDYSPSLFARKLVQPNDTVVFHANNGGPSTLQCSAEGATLTFAADLQTSRRSFRLVRSPTDVWGVAQQRGWPIGD